MKVDELEQKLIEMAEEWQCANNQLLRSAIQQYAMQRKICDRVMASILDETTAMANSSTNRYSGQTVNTANPLIRELPKLNDSAVKTANSILKIVTEIGIRPETKTVSALEKFLSEFGDDEDERDEEE